jgi:hypothetical protein
MLALCTFRALINSWVGKGAHKKVCVWIVQGWAEGDDFHVSLTQQGHALICHEVVKPGTAAWLELVRPDLDDALHFVCAESRSH